MSFSRRVLSLKNRMEARILDRVDCNARDTVSPARPPMVNAWKLFATPVTISTPAIVPTIHRALTASLMAPVTSGEAPALFASLTAANLTHSPAVIETAIITTTSIATRISPKSSAVATSVIDVRLLLRPFRPRGLHKECRPLNRPFIT